jgi:hypothetical protein
VRGQVRGQVIREETRENGVACNMISEETMENGVACNMSARCVHRFNHHRPDNIDR